MNITEFNIQIGKFFTYPNEKESKLTSLYQSEFGHYTGEKLQKVWDSVRRYHNKQTAPIIGDILSCMEKAGVYESKRDNFVYYAHCLHCDTNFMAISMGCPVCSWRIKESRPAKTEIEIIKAKTYPEGIKLINRDCPGCKKFKEIKIPMGAKCDAWGTFDMALKAGKDCKNCPCKDCCNEIPRRGIETGGMTVKELSEAKRIKSDYFDNVNTKDVNPPM